MLAVFPLLHLAVAIWLRISYRWCGLLIGALVSYGLQLLVVGAFAALLIFGFSHWKS